MNSKDKQLEPFGNRPGRLEGQIGGSVPRVLPSSEPQAGSWEAPAPCEGSRALWLTPGLLFGLALVTAPPSQGFLGRSESLQRMSPHVRFLPGRGDLVTAFAPSGKFSTLERLGTLPGVGSWT